ncbi:PdaC/SigV domain-containing protein [Erythrobacter sp. MTPC3]|uniref:PdaC/SigV domain-containing protein n=1 Tax=Erythrobacter sp. MTPC3 TaxID=3056564 RepID=UPI0036F337AB
MRNGLIGGAALAALTALAACSSPEEMGEDVGVAIAETASIASASAQAVPDAPKPVAEGAFRFEDTEEEGGAQRRFLYTWPKQVAAIPALAEVLEEERTAQLTEQQELWADMGASCPPDSASCRTATYEAEWSVVADTDRFLSLSSSIYTYTGGAHGNFGRGSIIWDREAGRSIDPVQFFTSPAALDDAIGDRACAMLNKEREERRGEPVPVVATDWPNQCVDIAEAVIFLGSSSGAKFDRIGVYYGPYVAGPYAEGDYELTLPVSAAILEAVEPAYRDAFAPAK